MISQALTFPNIVILIFCGVTTKWKLNIFQILIIGLEQMLFYQERKCGRYELLLLLLPQAFWRGNQKAQRHPSDVQIEKLLSCAGLHNKRQKEAT